MTSKDIAQKLVEAVKATPEVAQQLIADPSGAVARVAGATDGFDLTKVVQEALALAADLRLDLSCVDLGKLDLSQIDVAKLDLVRLASVASACNVDMSKLDLGMDVYGYDPFISVEHAWALSQSVQRVGTLEDLCRNCDYLTLHVPSKPDTVGMIGADQLGLLKPGAVLINFARETIIDEDAVDAALRGGRLSWFSCDFATPKTVRMPNTFITTHSGAGTGEAEANCADMAISELKDYLENGNIANSVNYPSCSMGKARAASRIACLHANVPNMIGQITAVLAHDNANVQRMVNESAGENAYTMFDTDEHLESKTIEALKEIPAVYRVRVIK